MTSNKLQYFSQNTFTGGIETRQELVKGNQVLDANNVWTPRAALERRPATKVFNVADTAAYPLGAQGEPVNSAIDTVFTIQSPSGNFTQPALPFDIGGLSPGNSLVFFLGSTTGGSNNWRADGLQLLVVRIGGPGHNTNATRYACEVFTERGWVNVKHNGPEYLFGESSDFQFQYISLTSPADTIVDPARLPVAIPGSGNRMMAVRLRILSVAPSAGLLIESNSRAYAIKFTPATPSNPNTPPLTNYIGAYRLNYSIGTKVLSISHISPTYTRIGPTPGVLHPVDAFFTFGTLDSFSYVPQRDYGGYPTSPATGLSPQFSFDYKNDSSLPLPPTVAVIPEFNTAFVALNNKVTEHSFSGATGVATPNPAYSAVAGSIVGGPNGGITWAGLATYQKVIEAPVNTDPNIVGAVSIANPAVPYPVDQVPQLNAFPQANLIVYFKNRLWAAGILGQPNLIRWSGSATDGAYNVWPEQSQAPLSTAKDNSEITAIAPLADNLVIFKKNSIWQMVDNGISDTGPQLALYEPRLVVAGVGTVAQATVQAVEGGLIFLSEDGFYFYDGTPNIKRISDPIQSYIEQINPSRTPYAQAVVWRTKHYYLCAVSVGAESSSNNYVFAYDYEQQAWWVWDGWDVQCWYQVDGVGLKEELYYLDRFGRGYQLGYGATDNGTPIETEILTPRWGFADVITKTVTDLRVRGINNNPPLEFDILGDDFESQVDMQIIMPRTEEAQYANDETYDVAVYAPERRRERKHSFRVTAGWFQVRIRNFLKLFGLDLGSDTESRR